MATTVSGVTIPGTSPSTTQVTPLQDHFNNLGKSLNGRVWVPVANTAGLATLVTNLTAEGYTPSASNPVFAWVVDIKELQVYDGATWRPLRFGAAPLLNQTIATLATNASGTYATAVTSTAFTVPAAGWVRIEWATSARVNVTAGWASGNVRVRFDPPAGPDLSTSPSAASGILDTTGTSPSIIASDSTVRMSGTHLVNVATPGSKTVDLQINRPAGNASFAVVDTLLVVSYL